MAKPRKIAVVDKHPLFVDALTEAFRKAWPDVVVSVADCITEDLIEGASDIVLVDLQTLSENCRTPLRAVIEQLEATPVAVMSHQSGSQQVLAAIGDGACAYLPKTLAGQAVCDAIALVLAGGACFPAHALHGMIRSDGRSAGAHAKREYDVLRHLDRGRSNKMIARELGISVAMVKVHVQAILRATHAKNRTEAIANARRMGMLPAD